MIGTSWWKLWTFSRDRKWNSNLGSWWYPKVEVVFGCSFCGTPRHEESYRFRIHPWKGGEDELSKFHRSGIERDRRQYWKGSMDKDIPRSSRIWSKAQHHLPREPKHNEIGEEREVELRQANQIFWHQAVLRHRSYRKRRNWIDLLSNRWDDCRLQYQTVGWREVHEVPRFDHESIGQTSHHWPAGVCWQVNLRTYENTYSLSQWIREIGHDQ